MDQVEMKVREMIYSVIKKTRVMKDFYERFKKVALLSFLIVHFTILGFAKTFYVSNNGSDAANGTSIDTPWKTLAKVSGFSFSPGDIISFKCGDSWREQLSIPSSGVKDNPIIFGTYGTGAKPRILGSSIETSWINVSGNIWKSTHTFKDPTSVSSYGCSIFFIESTGRTSWGRVKKANTSACIAEYDWTVTSGYIYIYSPTDPNIRYSGVEIPQRAIAVRLLSKQYITIDGLEIAYTGYFGIAESGSEVISRGLTIENCHIHHIGRKEYGMGIESFYSDVLIRNNEIDNSGRRNISLNLYENGLSVTNIIVENNILHDSFHTTGVDIATSGTSSLSNITIRNNLIYNTELEANIDNVEYFGSGFIYLAPQNVNNTINGVYVYNNVFRLITSNGFNIGTGYGATNVSFYNNTIYGVSKHITGTYRSVMLIEDGGNIVFKNNIIYNNVDINTNPTFTGIVIGATAGTVILDNNLYYNTSATRMNMWYGTTYTVSQWATYKSVSKQEANSILGQDPSFVSSSDFHLKSTSPAINAGTNVGTMTDFDGISIVGLPDLGAFEYGSTTDSEKPIVTGFTIPSTTITLSVPITTITATDNIGVTGYLLTETSAIPAVGASGWSLVKPATYTFSSTGSKTLYAWAKDAAGNVSASLKAGVTISSPSASTYTFTGPSFGNVNSPSANFTVTPNNVYTGTITITPTGAGSAGLSAKVLTFSNSSTAQTFSITPTVAGSITLMPTNNGTLTNPANLIYNAKAILPNAPTSVAATAGDASALVTFIAPTNTGGSAITGYTITSIPAGGVDTNAGSTSLTHSIGGLTNGTSYTFTVKAINSVGSSVASIASNSITPKVADVITKQGDIIPSHFKTVWEGLNGLNHMNINVVSATLEDMPLSVDDEIAVFSGSKCVGTTKLTQSIVSSDNTTFLSILASQDDGSGNGFSDNDTIVFKIWDSKTQSELQVNGVVYRNDVSTWKTNGRYSPGATTVVEIASYSVITQSIELLKGYNMISTYVSVQNPNVSAVTKSLQNQGSLIKMQDETGNSFENWGDFGGWINQLGSMEETEGYKIQVANNCTLQVTGRSIAMPFDISLKTGWNIISYPRTDMVNAMNVFQALIDQNKLVKVQDEAGNSIENWGLFGGWKNGIGNLIPGKAYKVKISADAILTFQESYPKSAVVLAKAEQTEYYHSSVEGNGTDHMNINITGLNGIGISVGDEIAAFDGTLCVATAKITEVNILSDAVSLASSVSTNDKNPDGFKVGDQIQISTWNKLSGDESKVNTEVITGQMKYEKNASVLVKMKSVTIATAITNLNDVVKIDVFPNPCQDRVTIRFSEIPEANSRIEISDISGRTLITRPISGNTEEINLDSFTPGLYLVKSILGKNEYVQKLIVNK